jgi:hypothetical protein
MIHKLVSEQCVIADHINLVAICKMDYIINGDIAVKEPAMCIIVMILAVEKKAAASLRV